VLPTAHDRGLALSTPLNVGVDKDDARVPDLGVFRRDTPRSSPAFLDTAELVVEVLSPGERAGEKLPFYASRSVREYLEVDLRARTVRLVANRDGGWVPIDRSGVVGLTTAQVLTLVPV
jgi:Uma2 family endonuclease